MRPGRCLTDDLQLVDIVAEHVELAHTNFTKLDWDEIWQLGDITADAADVQERLRLLEE